MVRNRSQLENLSEDDEILSLKNFENDINAKFSELNDRFNNFQVNMKYVN